MQQWMNFRNIILSRKKSWKVYTYDSIYETLKKIENETINHLKVQTYSGYPGGVKKAMGSGKRKGNDTLFLNLVVVPQVFIVMLFFALYTYVVSILLYLLNSYYKQFLKNGYKD